MPVVVGHIEALFRYPVKSMRGEQLAEAALGWHGIEGDRRFRVSAARCARRVPMADCRAAAGASQLCARAARRWRAADACHDA